MRKKTLGDSGEVGCSVSTSLAALSFELYQTKKILKLYAMHGLSCGGSNENNNLIVHFF